MVTGISRPSIKKSDQHLCQIIKIIFAQFNYQYRGQDGNKIGKFRKIKLFLNKAN